MGVFSASSLLPKLGEAAMGLSSSEGKVPDPGVWRDDEAVLALLSKPAAAMVAVAVAVAEAMVAACSRRRLRERVTDESNE